MRLNEKKRLALVLSGGGIKAAAFHLGVCLALREKGFQFAGGSPADVAEKFPKDEMTFKMYVGSSAGSVVSGFLASGYSVDAIISAFEQGVSEELRSFMKRRRDNEQLRPISYSDIFSLNGGGLATFVPDFLRRKSPIAGGFESLIKSGFKINGLFTTKGIERYMRKNVFPENRFSDLGVQLYVVATQLNHSRKVIFGNFPETYKVKAIKYANFATVSDAIAASASLPPFFAPYGITNQKGKVLYFFDGEIRDTLSTHVAADNGADLIVASYSIQPYHYNPEMGSLHKYGIPVIFNQALYQLVQQKIDKHIEFQNTISSILQSVEGYANQVGLPPEHRDKLLDIIVRRSQFKRDVDYIYIHPSPQDHEMFFIDHFSLNAKILARVVQVGFKSALQVLRRHDL